MLQKTYENFVILIKELRLHQKSFFISLHERSNNGEFLSFQYSFSTRKYPLRRYLLAPPGQRKRITRRENITLLGPIVASEPPYWDPYKKRSQNGKNVTLRTDGHYIMDGRTDSRVI